MEIYNKNVIQKKTMNRQEEVHKLPNIFPPTIKAKTFCVLEATKVEHAYRTRSTRNNKTAR